MAFYDEGKNADCSTETGTRFQIQWQSSCKAIVNFCHNGQLQIFPLSTSGVLQWSSPCGEVSSIL